MKKVFVFIPAFGQQVTTTTFLSVIQLQTALMHHGFAGGIAALSHPDIAELRNMALTIWFDRMDATHILFVDADMGFDPSLVMDMLAFDEPVVGVIAPKRTLPLEFAGSGFGDQELERRGQFVCVEGVGMGVTLIRRDAIAKMVSALPEIVDPRMATFPQRHAMGANPPDRLIRAFDKINIDSGWLSEDFSFCRRWRECGGEIWASIMHPITHVGPYPFTGRYIDAPEARGPVDNGKIAAV